MNVWEQMKKSFLNYNVDIKKQDEHLEEFKALTLAEQKQHLCELLDKNQLYVNLSSLNDADFACTAEEKKVTQNFTKLISNRMAFLYDILLQEFGKKSLTQVTVPNHITDNLKPGFGQATLSNRSVSAFHSLRFRRF